MTATNEQKYPKSLKGDIGETVFYFYGNVVKQYAFWFFCIMSPAYIAFLFFAHDYLRGAFLTQWEISKTYQVAFFTLLPAKIILNLVVYYHAYNLIINLGNNFYTPCKLGKQFNNYFSESLAFFFRATGPFLLCIGILHFTKLQFNPLVWYSTLIAVSILYEIACCTYGLRVAASVNPDFRKPQDWSIQSSIPFFKSHKIQTVSYAIMSTIGLILFVGIGGMLLTISSVIGLLFLLFAGALFVVFRATLHTKLLVNTDWNFVNDIAPEDDAMFAEFYKKKYIIILSTISSLVLVCVGYSAYHNSKYLDGRLIPDPIAPIVRENGTLDHTLVDWIFKKKKYFEHWVLRLPEGASITRPEDIRSIDYNSRLTFYLKMPDMSFLPDGENQLDKDVTRVSVNAGHLTLRGLFQSAPIKTGLSSPAHQLNCFRDKQIAPGFFQMRDATAAEKKAHDPSHKHDSENKCGFSGDYINYAHYDEAGNLLAKGKCRDSNILKSEHASCDFKIWLPQDRNADVDLAAKYLGNFPLIYQKIVTTLNDATVTRYSKNLKWKPLINEQQYFTCDNEETSLSNDQINKTSVLSQQEASIKNLSNDVGISSSGCEIPEVDEKDKLILLSAHRGAAFSNVTVSGPDKSTSAEEVIIKEGEGSIYLVLTSSDRMIWLISGATDRISHVVLTNPSGPRNGIIGLGVSGVDKSRVHFLRNPEIYLTDFTKADSAEATQAKDALRSLAGRNPDQISAIEELDLVNKPANDLNGELLRRPPPEAIEFDPADVISELPAELYEVLPEKAGLSQLIREGKIKRTRRRGYHINEKIRIPSGLNGANAVTFYVPIGVPKPDGNLGHSRVCFEATNKTLIGGRDCLYQESPDSR